MRISSTDSSNPGDLSLRIDSQQDIEKLAKVFPGFRKEKYLKYLPDGFPTNTSLIYDVIKDQSMSDDSKGMWIGHIGWDAVYEAIKVDVKVKWNRDDRGWDIVVQFSRGIEAREVDRWRTESEMFQSREKNWYKKPAPNIRYAVARALETYLPNLEENP